MYSTAKYAAPVWGHSAHMKGFDTALNNTLQIVTGCLRPTPTALLPPIAGIAPAKLWKEEIVDRLARQAFSICNHPLSCYIPDIHQLFHQCLVSRKPFPRHAANLIASNFNLQCSWNVEWEQVPCPSQFGVCPDITAPAGASLPHKLRVTLNRL